MEVTTGEVKDLPDDRLNWGLLSGAMGTTVRLLRNELTTRIVTAYAPFNLRSGALSTMVLIDANPGCSQSEIARELAIDDSAMVAIIDELETRGIAMRSRSATDRRRNTLSLTPDGRTFMLSMLEQGLGVEKPIRDALSPDEMAMLIRLLRQAYSALIASDGGAQTIPASTIAPIA